MPTSENLSLRLYQLSIGFLYASNNGFNKFAMFSPVDSTKFTVRYYIYHGY